MLCALAKPHHAGTVVRVGRIGTQTFHSGTGIHRSEHIHFAADVKVRPDDSSETVTVYYRVPDKSMIPAVGDRVEFADSLLVGNTPYPQRWAVRLGLGLLGLDAAVLLAALAAARRRKILGPGL